MTINPVSPADITSDLAVVISREMTDVIAWRNNPAVTPSPRIKIDDAQWQGDKLIIKLASGQIMLGVFTEVTGMTLP